MSEIINNPPSLLSHKRLTSFSNTTEDNEEYENETDAKFLKIPNKSSEPFQYILNIISNTFEKGIPYLMQFPNHSGKHCFISLCGYIPLYIGSVIKFTKEISIPDLGHVVIINNLNQDFFYNIISVFHVEDEDYGKLPNFNNGKIGYIYEGERDILLLIHNKGLDFFEKMEKIDDYTQFMLIKIINPNILNFLNIKLKIPELKDAFDKIEKYEKKIDDLKIEHQNEKISLINKNNKEQSIIKEEFIKKEEQYKKIIQKQKEELQEAINDNKKQPITPSKIFRKLEIYRPPNICYLYDNKNEDIISLSNQSPMNINENDKDDFLCFICFVNMRNIVFVKCGHCCICEECLNKFLHKDYGDVKKNLYFCPMCNKNETQTGKGDTKVIKLYFP